MGCFCFLHKRTRLYFIFAIIQLIILLVHNSLQFDDLILMVIIWLFQLSLQILYFQLGLIINKLILFYHLLILNNFSCLFYKHIVHNPNFASSVSHSLFYILLDVNCSNCGNSLIHAKYLFVNFTSMHFYHSFPACLICFHKNFVIFSRLILLFLSLLYCLNWRLSRTSDVMQIYFYY